MIIRIPLNDYVISLISMLYNFGMLDDLLGIQALFVSNNQVEEYLQLKQPSIVLSIISNITNIIFYRNITNTQNDSSSDKWNSNNAHIKFID